MKIQKETKKLLEIANNFRKENGYEHGFVTIFNCEVVGWILEIENKASTFMLGVMAIDINDNKYLAIGGNDYDGANSWQIIPSASN